MKITADNFFTTSDGIHIYFEDRGSGLPIVMVPGFLCTTKFFEKNAEVLSKEFRVITMDPRGQGNSSKTCQGNTIRRNAQDIKELIDHLGLEHVVLLGSGALLRGTRQTFARQDGDRISRGRRSFACSSKRYGDCVEEYRQV